MDEYPLFQPVLLTSNEPPLFDRHILKGVSRFGPNKRDKFTVYITPEAVIDLHEETLRKKPYEAYGLLMGRVYADNAGSFVVISRAIYTDEYETSTDHVRLSHEEMENLQIMARGIHPVGDIVGWTHSHSYFSEYSDVDYQEQRNWDEEYHVGILTFMDGVTGRTKSPWAVAYRGPDAQILYLARDIAPSLRENGELPSFTKDGQEIQEMVTGEEEPKTQKLPLRIDERTLQLSSPATSTRLPKKFFQPRWVLLGLGSLFALVAVLAIVVVGVVLGNILMLDWQHASPTSPSANLLWDCNQQTGHAPLKVTCAGPVGPAIKGCIWDFGDGMKDQRNSVSHLYQKAGVYKITLTVIASGNQTTDVFDVNAGSLTIEVT